MPQPTDDNNNKNKNSANDQMAQSMKTMNIMMPLMSGYFCFIMPTGVGLYWVFSNIIAGVQSVVLHKVYDPQKIAAEIEAAEEQKKEEK